MTDNKYRDGSLDKLEAEVIRNAVNNDERSINIMLMALRKETISLCRVTAYEYGVRLSKDEVDEMVQIATINLAIRHLPNFKIID
ncbi:MAG: hypothetical protein IK071_08650 [Lachnospiraceae bacterium]|nr:hypothetical protein [Lachnospiraceae bacterium]